LQPYFLKEINKMCREYHALVAGLYDLVFDDKRTAISPYDFKATLKETLHPDDFKFVNKLFLNFDNQEILSLLKIKKHGLDLPGNYSINDFEEEAVLQNTFNPEEFGLPAYIADFIHAYRESIPLYEGFSWENQLITHYYNYVLQTENSFLHDWFEFELNVTNILTAHNCRNYHIDPQYEIIGNNAIAVQLRKNLGKDFGLAADFPLVEKILQIASLPKIIDRVKGIDILKWEYLDEHSFFHYFDIEKVMTYLIKLFIVYRWTKLDVEKGQQMFNRILLQIEKSHEFPEEFKV
jgi:hypothetical protein